MALFDDTRSVERPRFFDGQQLFAADLDGIAAFHRELRRAHNALLHQPGIGNGFAVSGRRGDREVLIREGYAIDGEGQEIVAVDTQVEPVPPVASESDGGPVHFDLTVSYPTDDDLEEAETRAGVCLPPGVVRLRERPVFCWVRLRRDATGALRPVSAAHALDIQRATKIVVARAQVRECRLDADLETGIRRTARPPERPLIVCDCVAATWRPWLVPRPQSDGDGGDAVVTPIGLIATVDTRAAGFCKTPCYTARVHGPRPLAVPVPGTPAASVASVLVLDWPAYVVDETPTGFDCYVAVEVEDDDVTEELLRLLAPLADASWGITWLGIED